MDIKWLQLSRTIGPVPTKMLAGDKLENGLNCLEFA